MLPLLWLVAGCGSCTTEEVPPAEAPDQGKWFAQRYRTPRFDPDLTDEERARVEQLEALGYAEGTQAGSGLASVVHHDADRAWQGLNFYNSGHGPEAVLIDMDGQELHRWHHEFWDAFPDYPVQRGHGSTHNWRRAWLLDQGHILAIHEGLGLVRLDAKSRLVWANPGRMHHDLDFASDGTVLVLSREVRVSPGQQTPTAWIEDFVSWVDPATGAETRRVSLVEALRASPWGHLVPAHPDGDIFHTNTVAVLDGRAPDPAFAAGHILVSLRTPSVIAVLDPESERIAWAREGEWLRQHDPSVTRSGTLLLFDNRGDRWGSRVLRYTLPTLEPVWSWKGPSDAPLDSGTLGAVQELPNGDLLVTDSEAGRALEVDPRTGDVVWAFHNPHRAGPDDEYVAALFEMMRLPADTDIGWARGRATPPRGADPP